MSSNSQTFVQFNYDQGDRELIESYIRRLTRHAKQLERALDEAQSFGPDRSSVLEEAAVAVGHNQHHRGTDYSRGRMDAVYVIRALKNAAPQVGPSAGIHSGEDFQSTAAVPEAGKGTGWISVKDRLPPVGLPVVAHWIFKSVDGYECPDVVATYDGRIWHNPDDTDDDYTPPAFWMPIPEAPLPVATSETGGTNGK